jgi:hypothetical protein
VLSLVASVSAAIAEPTTTAIRNASGYCHVRRERSGVQAGIEPAMNAD